MTAMRCRELQWLICVILDRVLGAERVGEAKGGREGRGGVELCLSSAVLRAGPELDY